LWDSTNKVLLSHDGARWVPALPSYGNGSYNPEFAVFQQFGAGPDVSTDDTYCYDDWIALLETAGNWHFQSSGTAPPTGAANHIRVVPYVAGTPGTQGKFGLLQILEARDSGPYLELAKASLAFKCRYDIAPTGGPGPIKLGIFSWTGTADAVTSDIVSTWNADGVEPTWAAGWTLEGSTALTPTAAWLEYYLEDVAIDAAGVKQLGILIWTDDRTANQFVSVDFADVCLVPGAYAISIKYLRRRIDEEEHVAQRRYQKTFPRATTVAQNAGSTGAFEWGGTAGPGGLTYQAWLFATTMRVAPTVTTYNPSATNAQIRNLSTGADLSGTAVYRQDESSALIAGLVDAGGGFGHNMCVHATADARL
jgi:hypothetical protein